MRPQSAFGRLRKKPSCAKRPARKPISAVVFGGVTGSGSDLLVAAFQQAGSDLQTAVLQQGLLQDPIDKTIEFLIAFVILQTLSRRFVARFPQGEKAIGLEEA